MSITNISIRIKKLVLLRLINDGENISDASSKSGLCIKVAKKYIENK
ncbi:hypothetical protein [Arcobacter porcinus]|uniref:Uncharacterized protein n=1 Tax=Arcobacter porcinus TaxID=1935204 RepID=A0A1C0AW08_9BACT|nr:hypothetical protein [Arcobacter porcinus]OCL90726.1 hypothetical protein AAX27_01537 [Aliarcobacter thereius]OCL81810.1 hypothetical protein AAW29_01785 [Arcobacter porcinus]OCL82305.1 hypothetical protein AAW30_01592 [Arcobacter porcinus]OCL85390.1 hypothetical protein AAX30_01890 [Arcobacter porcinus]OCL90899.1 hypothetical protein AAX28_01718 [Arcobacter porcinus]